MSALAAVPMVHPAGYRVPPQNLEAEQALLGAILVNNKMYERVSDFLLPMHFFEPVHQRIYEAIEQLVAQGRTANPVSLKPMFDQDGALEDIGGGRYLAQIAASVVSYINCRDYGRLIIDCHTRRELIDAANDMMQDAYEITIEGNAEQVLEASQQRLGLIEAGRDTTGELGHVSSAADRAMVAAEHAYKNRGKITGTSTGIKPLDRKIGGLQPGDLLIIAGRPSMGKTALVTNIAHNVAKAYQAHQDADGKPVVDAGGVVAFFSLEMSAEQLVTRIIAGEIGVPADRIRNGEIEQGEFNRFHDEKLQIDRISLFIDDQTSVTTQAMRSRARRIKRQHGLHLIIVDYLQLLDGADGMSEQNRTQQISKITRGLKTMAKELNVPVIALSQLSRAVELREDRRPQLADLRDSGSIEQDADIVMFCYREEYYLERAEPTSKGPKETDEKFDARRKGHFERLNACAGKGEVIIGKQRHGPTATVHLGFDGPKTRWYDLYEGKY